MADTPFASKSISIVNKVGDSLYLTVKYFHNGDKGDFNNTVFQNQSLVFQGEANDCSMNLYSLVLDCTDLRRLADELERFETEARIIYRNEVEGK